MFTIVMMYLANATTIIIEEQSEFPIFQVLFHIGNCQITRGFQTNEYYLECKQKLQNIYNKKGNGIRIRSKCNSYENGKKSTKFFLNLEKYCATQGCLRL